jgi:D-glycero-beta-D-manno-heptose 1-phosphate adenylyltransferase
MTVNEKLEHIIQQKIVTRVEMKRIMDCNSNVRYVSTNGCFDMIHKGHLSLLVHARSLGDQLLVGLNSDHSVQARKGKDRPILKQDDRAMLLASLFFVDYVIIFEELEVNSLLAFLKPPIHVKGGDYKNLEELDEYETVIGYGGEIRILPMVPGYSTTRVIKHIQKPETNDVCCR